MESFIINYRIGQSLRWTGLKKTVILYLNVIADTATSPRNISAESRRY